MGQYTKYKRGARSLSHSLSQMQILTTKDSEGYIESTACRYFGITKRIHQFCCSALLFINKVEHSKKSQYLKHIRQLLHFHGFFNAGVNKESPAILLLKGTIAGWPPNGYHYFSSYKKHNKFMGHLQNMIAFFAGSRVAVGSSH